MQNQELIIKNDDIDIDKLLSTIVKRKLTIISVTVIAVLFMAIYAWSIKPIFNGEVLIEVGEVVNNNETINKNGTKYMSIFYLDDIQNLRTITAETTGLNVEIPSGTTNILRISTQDTIKSHIKPQLQKAVNFILQRHIKKAKLYQNDDSKINMTQVIHEIKISDSSKHNIIFMLLLASISGLIFGLFIAFTAEFLQRGRKKRG